MTQTLNGKDRRLAFEERLERMVSADVAAVRRGALVNLKLSPEDEERLAQMFTDADESLRRFREKNRLGPDRAQTNGTDDHPARRGRLAGRSARRHDGRQRRPHWRPVLLLAEAGGIG